MTLIPIPWICAIKLITVVSVIGLLVSSVFTYSRRIQVMTQEMSSSSEKAKILLEKIDREFEIINNCAKLIKITFLSIGKFYKEIATGSVTIEDAIREAKSNIPDNLKPYLSSLFNTQLEERQSTIGAQQSPDFYSDADFRKSSAGFDTMPVFCDVSSSEIILGYEEVERILNSFAVVPQGVREIFKGPIEVQP